MALFLDTGREALRCLWRGRQFAASAVLVLTLGVAAVTTAFAVVNGVILRPLPYKDADGLVVALGEVRAADYIDIRARTHVFSQTTLAGLYDGIIRSPGGPRRVQMLLVSPNFFSFMGLDPKVGRAFTPGEFRAGQDGVAFLSDRLRQTLFSPDAQPLGKTIDLNSRWRTVVGVAPPSFTFRLYWPAKPVDLWLPLTLTPRQLAMRGVTVMTMQGPSQEAYPYYTFFLGRLNKGVTLRRAQKELDSVVKGLITEHPEDKGLQGLQLWKLKDTRVRLAGETLWPLFGLSFALLAIACVNVAGLCLARWLGREREFAIRAALGAGAARLAALPVAEGLWIGTAAAGCGAFLSFGAVRWFRANAPGTKIPRLSGVAVDWKVLAFAAAASLMSAVVAGAAPALIRRNLTPATVLGGVGSPAGSPGRRQRFGGRALIFVQAAITTVLLAVAGLTLSGAWRLSHSPLGFRPEHVIQAQLAQAATSSQAWDQAQNSRLWMGLVGQAANIPGVKAVALTKSPFGLVSQCLFRMSATGNAAGGGIAAWFNVSPGYFHTLRIPLLSGRDFSDRDALGAPLVAIVNRGFERAYFSGSAVGQVVEVQISSPEGKWYRLRVVGVAQDNAMAGTWQASDSPAVYTNDFQLPLPSAFLLARTAPGAYPSLRAFTRTVSTLNSRLLVQDTQSLRQDIAEMLRLPRFFGYLFSAFAALALLLAFAGVYGVASVSARLKRREIGIRCALGASRAGLVGTALRESAVLGAAGAACGLVVAKALTGMLQAWLFGLRPVGAWALSGAAAAILLACLLGTLLPAARVLRDEPARVLRLE